MIDGPLMVEALMAAFAVEPSMDALVGGQHHKVLIERGGYINLDAFAERVVAYYAAREIEIPPMPAKDAE